MERILIIVLLCFTTTDAQHGLTGGSQADLAQHNNFFGQNGESVLGEGFPFAC